jgi:uncharacterized protein YndB with AHSA1/START domain
MATASSAMRTWTAPASASEYTATVRRSSSRQARITRQAISPRLAIRTLVIRLGGTALHYQGREGRIAMPEKSNLVANASTTIHAPISKVWDALINPDAIKKYMFGATVVSDWKQGSPIVWKGEWKGKPYEDKGVVLEVDPHHRLVFDHYSPLTGPDVPDNHHKVTIELAASGADVRLSLSQDNNASEDARKHSQQNWESVVAGIKKVAES